MNRDTSCVVALLTLFAVLPAGAQVGPGMTSPAQDQARAAAQDQARRDAANDHEAFQQQRQNAAGQSAARTKQSQDIKALREKLLRTPPLPAERNSLLGQWSVEKRARRKDALTDMFDSVVNIGSTACESLFGTGMTEFKATSWSSSDCYGSDSLGSIQYRGEGKRVWAIPANQGMQLLGFDFVSPERVKVVPLAAILDGCTLVRIGASSAAAQGEAASRSAASPAKGAPPTQSASADPSRPWRAPDAVCSRGLHDKLGKVDVKQVRQTIEGRFRQTTDAKVPNTQNLRIDARGSGCDDTRIAATLYDFDASGVLQSITFVWPRAAGPAPAPIFSERAKELSLTHGGLPAPQSAGRLQADTVVGILLLQDLPEQNAVLEAYVAKK